MAAPHRGLVDPSTAERLKALFLSGFTVMDIAEMLVSFDRDAEAATVRERLDAYGYGVAGVRSQGAMAGFVLIEELAEGGLGTFLHPFQQELMLDASASLATTIQALDRQPFMLVELLGQPAAIVTRSDLQKPAVRMWLFSMVTVLEMNLQRTIDLLFPNDQWTEALSPGRRRKAEALQQERLRRKQPCTLAECLQFSDKARILTKDSRLMRKLGFASKRDADRNIKEMERLRNHLAHSQDIVTHDWQTMVDLSSRVEGLLSAERLNTLIGSTP